MAAKESVQVFVDSTPLKTHKVQIFASAANKIEISCCATTPNSGLLARINEET
jgi:hypothetical protein